ncbi:MAG: gliding motility protein GldC [Spirochaetales bacterium]|nr:gliding motility protein GldC [Spirochaetales bacterium]
MKERSIEIVVTLDENNIPEKIVWRADDAGFSGYRPASSMSLAFWEQEREELLSMELWTKDHSVEHMQRQIMESLFKLSDACQRATGDHEMARVINETAKSIRNMLGKGKE